MLLYGHARGFIHFYMASNLSCLQTIVHLSSYFLRGLNLALALIAGYYWLQPYQYTARYIKGYNNIADALSRLLPKSSMESEPQSVDNIGQEYIRFVACEPTPCAMTTREIERASKNDVELHSIRDCL